jgi:hypothetical protein
LQWHSAAAKEISDAEVVSETILPPQQNDVRRLSLVLMLGYFFCISCTKVGAFFAAAGGAMGKRCHMKLLVCFHFFHHRGLQNCSEYLL